MISAKTKTTVKGQEGFDRLRRVLTQYKNAYVTIGVHEGAGEYQSGISVVQVALFNEYGTERSPARSFIASTIDDKEAEINEIRDKAIDAILEGKMDIDKALQMIGFRIQTLIQNKIKSNVPPPNAPSTLKQKAKDGVGSATLIHTGLLLRSITYKVTLS